MKNISKKKIILFSVSIIVVIGILLYIFIPKTNLFKGNYNSVVSNLCKDKKNMSFTGYIYNNQDNTKIDFTDLEIVNESAQGLKKLTNPTERFKNFLKENYPNLIDKNGNITGNITTVIVGAYQNYIIKNTCFKKVENNLTCKDKNNMSFTGYIYNNQDNTKIDLNDLESLNESVQGLKKLTNPTERFKNFLKENYPNLIDGNGNITGNINTVIIGAYQNYIIKNTCYKKVENNLTCKDKNNMSFTGYIYNNQDNTKIDLNDLESLNESVQGLKKLTNPTERFKNFLKENYPNLIDGNGNITGNINTVIIGAYQNYIIKNTCYKKVENNLTCKDKNNMSFTGYIYNNQDNTKIDLNDLESLNESVQGLKKLTNPTERFKNFLKENYPNLIDGNGNITGILPTSIIGSYQSYVIKNTCYIKSTDNIAPKITNLTNSTGKDKWTTKSTTISWKITENESGIKNVQYRLNKNGEWKNLDKSEWYGFTRNNDRNDIVEIRVVDNAGNISNIVSTTLKIDKTAPAITAKIYKRNTKKTNGISDFIYSTSSSYEFARWFNSNYPEGVEIAFYISDNMSGLSKGIWSWNNGKLSSFQTTGMTKSSNKITDNLNVKNKNVYHSVSGEGYRVVNYEVTDSAGNKKNIVLKFKIDRTAPSKVTIVGRKDNKNGQKVDLTKNQWHNYNIYIEKVKATDKNNIAYYQGRDCTTKKITADRLKSWGDHIEKEGSRCRQIRAVDNAGNYGNWSSNLYFKILYYNWPVSNFKTLSTKFNEKGHKGIDIIQSKNQKNINGAKVTAIHNGEVVAAYDGCNDDYSKRYNASTCGVKASPYITQTGYGNYVVIKHSNKKETIYSIYGHLKKGIKVKKGSKVSKGQLIGYVGSTGNATGPHLHFEIQNANKKVINPTSKF